MSDKLAEIISHKRQEIEPLVQRAEKLRYAALERNEFKSLASAINVGTDRLGLIAEVKKASPSAGIIAKDFDPVSQAKKYADAGASAISVLTDEKYFKGKLEYLTQIQQAVDVPVLRKDFIVHESQIYEASVAGADAVLLIVAALSQEDLERLFDCANTYQLEVLMEAHDLPELERALETDVKIIGVNNRNLKTFEDILFVSESGIKTPQDASLVASWGADAVLVGETLMRAGDVASTVKEIMESPAS